MSEGFISLHRKIMEWEWYQDNNARSLFIHMLLMANWKDKKWRGVLIKRGQFITSYESLARQIGLTAQQIRTAINKLKSTGEITHKHTNKYSVITINKYEEYQDINRQPNRRVTVKQQSSNKQVTTTNKENKDNKENKRENHLNYLLDIKNDTKELTDLTSKFKCTQSDVIKKAMDFHDYCVSKGKMYKNYKSALSNALSKDFGRRLTESETVSVSVKYDEAGNAIGGVNL